MHDVDPARKLAVQAVRDPARPVGRAVVDDEDAVLQAARGALGQRAADGFLERRLLVERRNDDRDRRSQRRPPSFSNQVLVAFSIDWGVQTGASFQRPMFSSITRTPSSNRTRGVQPSARRILRVSA